MIPSLSLILDNEKENNDKSNLWYLFGTNPCHS